MNGDLIKSLFFIIGLTLLSGFGDAQGFLHAANIWSNGKLNGEALGKSALGFGVGIITYWLIIRYLQRVGIVSPELQTILWFSATIIGIALLSGKFLIWQRIDQVIAILVVLGVGWLLFRIGE